MEALEYIGAGVMMNHMTGNPIGKAWNKIDPLKHFRVDKPNSFNGVGKNDNNNHQDGKTDNSFDKHDKPLNSDDKSVLKEAEKSKKMSISEQIDAQGKYDKEVNTLKSQFAEQNKLNGSGTPEMLEKQAQKLESLEKA